MNKNEKKCTCCKEIFPLTSEFFWKDTSRNDGWRPTCKECSKKWQQMWRKKNKESDKRRGRKHLMKKRLEKTGMKKCAICGKKVTGEDMKGENRYKFIAHHISYIPERLVLLCTGCHGWLHGNNKIYRHPFKDKYDKDIAPFEFAKKVVELYMDYDSRMWEVVEINLKELFNEHRAKEIE